MLIGLAVLFKIAFITAGRDHRTILCLKDTKIIFRIFWILNGNSPFASICFDSKYLYVSAKAYHSACDAMFTENIHDPSGSIALCDSSEINLHSILFKADGLIFLIKINF